MAQRVELRDVQREDPKAWRSEEERLARFAEAIDAIGARAHARVGVEDVAIADELERFAKRMEILGRTLIHVSLDPFTFLIGVGALTLYKQIHYAELGHAILHGAFDDVPGADRYRSATYEWPSPVNKDTFRHYHRGPHHARVNIAGKDDNITYGFLRATELTPHRWYHVAQLPYMALVLMPGFSFLLNAKFAGFEDLLFSKEEDFFFVSDRSWRTIKSSVKKAAKAAVPYYFKEFVAYPALAGPFFPKVLVGNLLADLVRDATDAFTAVMSHCAGTAAYPKGTRPRTRGEYCKMQVEATLNFETSLPVSMFVGAFIDCHIEHHLFPRLPSNRLREVKPEVKAACEAFGIRYPNETSLWSAAKKTVRRLYELSRDTRKTPRSEAAPAPVRLRSVPSATEPEPTAARRPKSRG